MYEKAEVVYGQCDVCGYHRGKHQEGCLDGEPRPLSLGFKVSLGVVIVVDVIVWSDEIVSLFRFIF